MKQIGQLLTRAINKMSGETARSKAELEAKITAVRSRLPLFLAVTRLLSVYRSTGILDKPTVGYESSQAFIHERNEAFDKFFIPALNGIVAERVWSLADAKILKGFRDFAQQSPYRIEECLNAWREFCLRDYAALQKLRADLEVNGLDISDAFPDVSKQLLEIDTAMQAKAGAEPVKLEAKMLPGSHSRILCKLEQTAEGEATPVKDSFSISGPVESEFSPFSASSSSPWSPASVSPPSQPASPTFGERKSMPSTEYSESTFMGSQGFEGFSGDPDPLLPVFPDAASVTPSPGRAKRPMLSVDISPTTKAKALDKAFKGEIATLSNKIESLARLVGEMELLETPNADSLRRALEAFGVIQSLVTEANWTKSQAETLRKKGSPNKSSQMNAIQRRIDALGERLGAVEKRHLAASKVVLPSSAYASPACF